MKKVILIVGPTASGKTSLSIQLAKYFNLEIINGDSTQVYKNLDIGTAKIKEEEKQGIKHYLLDILEYNGLNNYTVYEFQKDVRHIIEKNDKPLIICGGSGFYLKSCLYDYKFENQDIKIDFSNIDKDTMLKKIYEKDPDINIDQNNLIRIKNAYLQVINGKIPSKNQNKNIPLYDIFTIYIDLHRDKQKDIFLKRILKQLNDGFIEEVKRLRKNNIFVNNILGYKEINMYLDNLIDYDTMIEKILYHTLDLAKKQKTWFKNQIKPDLFISYDDINIKEKAILKLKEFLND